MMRLLSAAEVGERLGIAAKTARKYMKDMCVVVLPGGDIRVEEDELNRWINARRLAPATGGTMRRKTARAPRVYDPALFEPDGRIKRRKSGGRTA